MTRTTRRIAWPLLAVALFLIWWVASAPPAHHKPGEAVDLGEPPAAIETVRVTDAAFAAALETLPSDVPGHDDIWLREERGEALVPAMDGWFWRVPLNGGQAARFVDVPLMPSGVRESPTDANVVYFCASRLHGAEHPADERVGLYRLDAESKTVAPIVTDVPLTPDIPPNKRLLFPDGAPDAPRLQPRETSRATTPSRPLAFCNDLDVSVDGDRIYFTEPFAYEGASMGGGAVGEAITLGDNGRLWRHELSTGTTELVADGFHFVDGILVDLHPEGEREQSVLVTQTPGFAITRFYIAGPRAGQVEPVWTGLPGMPDGMDRDAEGRIWVGLFKTRSTFLTWAHRNPWIKPLLLRLPLDLLPVPTQTGILGLSPDGASAIYFATHDSPKLRDAAVVVPGARHLYIANFDRHQRGLVRTPYPK